MHVCGCTFPIANHHKGASNPPEPFVQDLVVPPFIIYNHSACVEQQVHTHHTVVNQYELAQINALRRVVRKQIHDTIGAVARQAFWTHSGIGVLQVYS